MTISSSPSSKFKSSEKFPGMSLKKLINKYVCILKSVTSLLSANDGVGMES